VKGKDPSPELFEEACGLFGVDRVGLTKDDQRYLDVLVNTFKGGPTGVRNIATALHEEAATLEDLYEPFLFAKGFIERTPRGRIATSKAREHLSS
jgi:Holliday junction DNA helicase RuvB